MLYVRRMYDGTVLEGETQLYYVPGYYGDGMPVSGIGVADYVAYGRSSQARYWQYGSCAILLALSFCAIGSVLAPRSLYLAVIIAGVVLWLVALYCEHIAMRSHMAFALLRLVVVGCSAVMIAGLLVDPVLIEYQSQIDLSPPPPRWLFIVVIVVLDMWVVLRFLQDRKIARYSRQRIDESESWLQLVRAMSLVNGYGYNPQAVRVIDRLESVRGEELSRLLDLYFAEALPLEQQLAACTDQETRHALLDRLAACAKQYAKPISKLL